MRLDGLTFKIECRLCISVIAIIIDLDKTDLKLFVELSQISTFIETNNNEISILHMTQCSQDIMQVAMKTGNNQ